MTNPRIPGAAVMAAQELVDDLQELKQLVKTLKRKRNVGRVQQLIESLEAEVSIGADMNV